MCTEPELYQSSARTSEGVDTSKLIGNPRYSRVHHVFDASLAHLEPDVVASVQARCLSAQAMPDSWCSHQCALLRTSQALEQIDYLGVLELPEESWCLLQLQLRGELPAVGCSCAEFEQLPMSYINHSVPEDHISISDVSETTRSAIDEITRVDAQVPYPTDPSLWRLTESREGSHIQTNSWCLMLHPCCARRFTVLASRDFFQSCEPRRGLLEGTSTAQSASERNWQTQIWGRVRSRTWWLPACSTVLLACP